MLSEPTLGEFWGKAKEAYSILESAYYNNRDPLAVNSIGYYTDKDNPAEPDIRLQISKILSYLKAVDQASGEKMEQSAETCDNLFPGEKKDKEITYIAPTTEIEHELMRLSRSSKDLLEEIFKDFDIGNRVVQFVGFTDDKEANFGEATIGWQDHTYLAMQYRDRKPNMILSKTIEIIPDEKVESYMNYRVGLDQIVDLPPSPGDDRVYESILSKPQTKSVKRMNYYRLKGFTIHDEDFFTMDVTHVKPYGKYSQGRIHAKARYHSCLTDKCMENKCYTTELPLKKVFEKFSEIEEKLLEIYPGKIAKGIPKSDKTSVLMPIMVNV